MPRPARPALWAVLRVTLVLVLPAACAAQPLPAALAPLADTTQYVPWASNLSAFRNASLAALGAAYSDAAAEAAFSRQGGWMRNASLLVHVMSFDRRIASPSAANGFSNWTAAAFVADLLLRVPRRPDVAVLWATLPALGLDSRNQFELARSSLPGSSAGGADRLGPLRAATQAFHALVPPVRVLFAVVPWDAGTQPEADQATLAASLTFVLTNCSLDGAYFADSGQAAFAASEENVTSTYFVLAADGEMPLAAPAAPAMHPLAFQHFSRVVGALDVPAAGGAPPAAAQLPLSSYRYLERRHVQLVGSDWARGAERTAGALSAFVEGGALSISENAFGFANIVTPREGQLLARAAELLAFVAPVARSGAPPLSARPLAPPRGDPLPDGLRTVDWLPLLPSSASSTLAASQFSAPCPIAVLPAGTAGSPGLANNCTVWLVVNLGLADVLSATLNVSIALDIASASGAGGAALPPGAVQFYDLYRGLAANATPTPGPEPAPLPPMNVSSDALTFSVEALSIAAFLAVPSNETEPATALVAFLSAMANLTARPLADFSSTWAALPQTFTPVNATGGGSGPPPGSVLVPGMRAWRFSVAPLFPGPFTRADAARAVLGLGVDTQYPWEAAPSANHSAVFDVFPYYLDARLVTNADFKAFVDATGYNASGAGLDPANYLRHWVSYANGSISFNESNDDGPRPVVFVAAGDASAFCAWRGMRLPTEWELQFAGQQAASPAGGSDYRAFPWGNVSCAAADPRPCAPEDNSTSPRSPDFVGSLPAGASAGGVLDLVGLVWQLSDSYCDAVSCALVLRGGSFYRPLAALSNAADGTASTLPAPPLYAPADGALLLTSHLRLPYLNEAGQRGALIGFRCAADTEGVAERGGPVPRALY